jgi:hypothetical protein
MISAQEPGGSAIEAADARTGSDRTNADESPSDLAGEGLTHVEPIVRNGGPLLPPCPGSRPVTLTEVNRLRDTES